MCLRIGVGIPVGLAIMTCGNLNVIVNVAAPFVAQGGQLITCTGPAATGPRVVFLSGSDHTIQRPASNYEVDAVQMVMDYVASVTQTTKNVVDATTGTVIGGSGTAPTTTTSTTTTTTPKGSVSLLGKTIDTVNKLTGSAIHSQSQGSSSVQDGRSSSSSTATTSTTPVETKTDSNGAVALGRPAIATALMLTLLLLIFFTL